MRRLSLWVLVFIVLILEVTLFSKIEVWDVRPDAKVIVLVYVALANGPVVGALFGFMVGLLELALLSTAMASAPLAATVVGFAVGRYGTKIMYESLLVQMLLVFASVIVLDSVNFLWTNPGSAGLHLARFSVPAGVYTALLSGILAFVVERIAGLRLVA
jgi:rod shape-determining protein MreD